MLIIAEGRALGWHIFVRLFHECDEFCVQNHVLNTQMVGTGKALRTERGMAPVPEVGAHTLTTHPSAPW